MQTETVVSPRRIRLSGTSRVEAIQHRITDTFQHTLDAKLRVRAACSRSNDPRNTSINIRWYPSPTSHLWLVVYRSGHPPARGTLRPRQPAKRPLMPRLRLKPQDTSMVPKWCAQSSLIRD